MPGRFKLGEAIIGVSPTSVVGQILINPGDDKLIVFPAKCDTSWNITLGSLIQKREYLQPMMLPRWVSRPVDAIPIFERSGFKRRVTYEPYLKMAPCRTPWKMQAAFEY